MNQTQRLTAVAILGVAIVLGIGFVVHFPWKSEPPRGGPAGADLKLGEYLIQAGNCYSCHTAHDGKPYAGGRPVATPYGTLYSSNITPDPQTGVGNWSADDFWRALHEGKSKDGSLLYPAFPYWAYTKVTREHADAMYAYLKSIPPVSQQNRAHEMRFPYDQRPLLAGWQALYFREGEFKPDPRQTPEWNRGAYLVEGLGHCAGCHGQRGAWGSVREKDIGGGLIPMLNWYAPSLGSKRDADEIAEFLKHGVSSARAAFGPMSEVIRDSLQHLEIADLRAMAVYLASRGDGDEETASGPRLTSAQQKQLMELGARVYHDRCADCHQQAGEGVPRVYPRLAANEAILMRNPVNAVRIVLNGGFPPSTRGNPRPYGMPPFAHVLSDGEVAAVVTYIRGAWGNRAAPVSAVQVASARGVPLD
ncbi:MAG TPA: cytochrome c [Burkholderiales bacterium]|jgi:mono/diheme cytochrome c family protein|nr:cytochrome c [Burkholderiales bacterium]